MKQLEDAKEDSCNRGSACLVMRPNGFKLHLWAIEFEGGEADWDWREKADLLQPTGDGGAYLVDVDPKTGERGCVFLLNHDPNVCLYLAESVEAFVELILDDHRTNHNLDKRIEEHIDRAYGGFDQLSTAGTLLQKADPELKEFAATLPPEARVADLRKKEFGSGYSLQHRDFDWKRHGQSLLWGITVRPSKGCLGIF